MQTIPTHPYKENKVLETFYDAENNLYYTENKPQNKKGLIKRFLEFLKPPYDIMKKHTDKKRK